MFDRLRQRPLRKVAGLNNPKFNLRPRAIGQMVKIMKRISNPYAIELVSDRQEKYINEFSAISAANALAFAMVTQGFLTCTSFDPLNKRYEVCVYFDFEHIPVVPHGYSYTWRSITSSQSSYSGKRIRCITYHFDV